MVTQFKNLKSFNKIFLKFYQNKVKIYVLAYCVFPLILM